MSNTARRVAVGGVALAGAGLAIGLPATAQASTPGSSGPVFVQTDNPAGNAVVVYDRSFDGRLHQAGTYPTGGSGGVLDGSVVDHLASQGALAYDRAHRLLYAVNAGSDTVTVFAVHGNALYVLNARGGGTVQGFLRLDRGLVRVPSWHRDLGLDPTLTPEFTSTPGQVAVTPDGTKLIVTTKGNGNEIAVFGVDAFGGLSATPVVTDDPAAVPFAVAFDPAGHVAVAEAGTNAVARFAIGADRRLTLIDRTPTGQAATCWIVATGADLYTSNAGSASVSGFARDGRSLTSLGNTATDAGTVDAAATPDGRYLYVQTGAAGIVDEFDVDDHGSLSRIGSVTVPGAVGGEGIVAG